MTKITITIYENGNASAKVEGEAVSAFAGPLGWVRSMVRRSYGFCVEVVEVRA